MPGATIWRYKQYPNLAVSLNPLVPEFFLAIFATVCHPIFGTLVSIGTNGSTIVGQSTGCIIRLKAKKLKFKKRKSINS